MSSHRDQDFRRFYGQYNHYFPIITRMYPGGFLGASQERKEFTLIGFNGGNKFITEKDRTIVLDEQEMNIAWEEVRAILNTQSSNVTGWRIQDTSQRIR